MERGSRPEWPRAAPDLDERHDPEDDQITTSLDYRFIDATRSASEFGRLRRLD